MSDRAVNPKWNFKSITATSKNLFGLDKSGRVWMYDAESRAWAPLSLLRTTGKPGYASSLLQERGL